MKNNILQFNECANCGACYNACLKDAISVNSDGLFYALTVDEDKCVSCGKCVALCPVNREEHRQDVCSAIGGYSKDNKVVKRSSSGGAFYVFAQYILKSGGVVYGAAYSSDCRSVEMKSTDEVTLEELLRSKYVESLAGDSFKKIKKQLEDERMVLFCGTPCQVAGLKRYLGREYKSLYTCDFSCGGLPSHKIYNDHIDALETQYHSKIKSVNFRPKTYGWAIHAIRTEFFNGEVYNMPAMLDHYFAAFIQKHITTRYNCNYCKFANNHYSDIILADFWLNNTISHLQHNDGISLIIANSDKGEQLLNAVKECLVYEDIDIKKASYNLVRKEASATMLTAKREFINAYQEGGYEVLKTTVNLPRGVNRLKILFKCSLKKLFVKRSL